MVVEALLKKPIVRHGLIFCEKCGEMCAPNQFEKLTTTLGDDVFENFTRNRRMLRGYVNDIAQAYKHYVQRSGLDPYTDQYVDVQGYRALVENRLEGIRRILSPITTELINIREASLLASKSLEWEDAKIEELGILTDLSAAYEDLDRLLVAYERETINAVRELMGLNGISENFIKNMLGTREVVDGVRFSFELFYDTLLKVIF